MKSIWMLCLGLFCATSAQAHDSWFEAVGSPASGQMRLHLGTGNRFPAQESSVGPGALVAHGCRTAPGALRPLRIERDRPQALVLRAAVPRRTSTTCHATLVTHSLELKDAKLVQAYFAEIQSAPALREAWAEMQERGLPWQERYTKHARIEFFGEGGHSASPSGMALDIVLDALAEAPRAGSRVAFTLLHHGQPLAGQPVELVSGQWPYSRWLRTDAEGRAQAVLPAAGRWLLRAVHLRVASQSEGRWQSDFVTLAFTAR